MILLIQGKLKMNIVHDRIFFKYVKQYNGNLYKSYNFVGPISGSKYYNIKFRIKNYDLFSAEMPIFFKLSAIIISK